MPRALVQLLKIVELIRARVRRTVLPQQNVRTVEQRSRQESRHECITATRYP